MNIDWNQFSPWGALAGSAMLGLASVIFMLVSGRILGISGVLGGLLSGASWRNRADWSWRLAFILGLVASPWVYFLVAPANWIKAPTIEASTAIIILAGLLVGFGTRYGSGCTSGHGVCGLSRLSLRSLLATLTFMALGFVTVYLMRHVYA
jgi:uncharacterized membrane protein YedE/YeeE